MHGHKAIVSFLFLVSTVDRGASQGRQGMTPFSANSTCAESARASGASGLQSRLQTRTAERHERTPQDASCSRTASLSFLSSTPEPASGAVVVVLLLLGAYYSPEGLAPYVCLLLMSAIS